MKWFFSLAVFLSGCSQDIYFISNSVVQDINQSCSNLPADVDREWQKLLDKGNKLGEDHDRIVRRSSSKEIDNKTNHNRLIKNYDKNEKFYYDLNGFLKKEQTVFIDCLGTDKFKLILDYTYLKEQNIRWLEKVNTLNFRLKEVFAIIRKKNILLPSYVLDELQVLYNKIKKITSIRYRNINQSEQLKTYSEKIIWTNNDSSLLKEKSELTNRVLNILEGYL